MPDNKLAKQKRDLKMEKTFNSTVIENKNFIRENGLTDFEMKNRVRMDSIEYAVSLAWAGYRIITEEWEEDNKVFLAIPEKFFRNGSPDLFGIELYFNEVGYFITQDAEFIPLIIFTEDNSGHAPEDKWIITDEVFADHFREYKQIVGNYWGIKLDPYGKADTNIGRILHNPHKVTAPRTRIK